MLARLATFAIDGVLPRQVWVEVDIRSGLPAFTIVGLGDTAVRESRDRIRAAIQNSGFDFPKTRITANLAPAFLRKVGPGFDAALALGVLAASDQVPAAALRSYAVFGELSLSGDLRDSPGALAVAEGTRRAGLSRLIVPSQRGRGRPQSAAGGRAGDRQDDARPEGRIDPSCDGPPRGGRGDPHPQRRRALRGRSDHEEAVSRAASHDLVGGTRGRRLASSPGR